MNRGSRKFTTAHFAIATAMLCSTPAAFAQEIEAPPVVVAPPPIVQSAPSVTSAPVASPTVAPPPMVPTISQTPQAPVATREPVKQRAAAKPAAKAAVRTTPAASPVLTAPADEPKVINAPMLDEPSTVTATIEDSAPVAPVDHSALTPTADDAGEDWIIYGGLAAALGLAGLGGLLARRRRRTSVSVEPTLIAPNTSVGTAAPRPLPVQQSAAPVERLMVPATAPVSRPRFADAHLPPVTDPLFAHRPVMRPITDPLFFQTIAMPPVTDPMFADTPDYAGTTSTAAAFDKRRTWPTAPTDERKPLHEFEPAE